MANKPVIGLATCSICSAQVPVIWDGNRKQICPKCGKYFKVKRTALRNTQPVHVPRDGGYENER